MNHNYLKYEFHPFIWNKFGNNSNTKIICSFRTTSSNSVIIHIQAIKQTSQAKLQQTSQAKLQQNSDGIDVYLLLWVYNIIRGCVLKKLQEKASDSSVLTALRLKDIDPYLFSESVCKGGYTRKCSNWKDHHIGNRMRFRQPMIININNNKDMEIYNSLKKPSYIVKYRNNYYVGMKDELENASYIEEYNKKVSTDKEKIEYFNTIIMFEIHEEKYRAPNAQAGLLYPACVRSKERLSKRHIDLMREAYLNKEIEIFGIGKDDLIKQLERHSPNSNGEVGYIMQATRTLPIGNHGHLPSNGSGVYEWFRQCCPNFKESEREFLRKGTVHDDKYNFIHAIFDCIDHKGYKDKNTKEKKELVEYECKKYAKYCSYGLFRTLQDGTLAQKTVFERFIGDLDNPLTDLLHSEYSDLFSYILNLNIVIMDCDTYSHSKIEKQHYQFRRWIAPFSAFLCSRYMRLVKLVFHHRTIATSSDYH